MDCDGTAAAAGGRLGNDDVIFTIRTSSSSTPARRPVVAGRFDLATRPHVYTYTYSTCTRTHNHLSNYHR
eukprot:23374-Pelagococcus_subviridis.AAC.1